MTRYLQWGVIEERLQDGLVGDQASMTCDCDLAMRDSPMLPNFCKSLKSCERVPDNAEITYTFFVVGVDAI
ncbi:MAG: hypothetical protein R2825_17365 [Saprospiraceae bacterium]